MEHIAHDVSGVKVDKQTYSMVMPAVSLLLEASFIYSEKHSISVAPTQSLSPIHGARKKVNKKKIQSRRIVYTQQLSPYRVLGEETLLSTFDVQHWHALPVKCGRTPPIHWGLN